MNSENYPKVAAEMSDEELATRLADLESRAEEVFGGTDPKAQSETAPIDLVAEWKLDNLIECWRGEPPIWKSNAHAFGYISEPKGSQGTLEILEVGDVPPDLTLRNGRINITLNFLRVASYP